MAKPLSTYETKHVITALDALLDGNIEGYRWALWIGLGDGWCAFHDRLIKEQAVARERVGGGGGELALTPRGSRIRSRLALLGETGRSAPSAGSGSMAAMRLAKNAG